MLDRNELTDMYLDYKTTNPKARIRNAAEDLSVSELELLLTQVDDHVQVIADDLKTVFTAIATLGEVMALTRNDSTVHERKGVYEKPTFSKHHILYANPDIDLRIFPGTWKFFVIVENKENDRKSIQFYNKHGEALHKVYLTNKSIAEAYEALKGNLNFTAIESVEIESKPEATPSTERTRLNKTEAEEFKATWLKLTDTHQFFGMLKQFNLARTSALEYAPEGYAYAVDNTVVETMLNEVSTTDMEIMCFVGNSGIIQIHTGKTKKIVWHGPWINVLDPSFNLHLKLEDIAEAWMVKKPTEDGAVHAIECFNAQGEMLVQFFGKRKPGIPELDSWKYLCENLAHQHALKTSSAV